MIDQATNGDGDSGRFKILNDWEHDDPAQAPSFKRDQQLTPAALFKAKVLAVLRNDLRLVNEMPSEYSIGASAALLAAIGAVEGIAP